MIRRSIVTQGYTKIWNGYTVTWWRSRSHGITRNVRWYNWI